MYIGIDLGGTNAKIGAVTEHGQLLEQAVQSTNIDNPDETIDGIAILIRAMCANHSEHLLKGVGCGVPGILDRENGKIIRTANLRGWNDYRLKEALEDRLKQPVRIENDAKIAALGEAWLGAGQSVADFLMVTLGTGIGGALILDSNPYKTSCEFGHTIIDMAGAPCTCGRIGCLETYFSSHGLLRLLKQELENGTHSRFDMSHVHKLKPVDIANAADRSDPAAVNAFHNAGTALGIAMGNITNLIGIHFFIIGGGIANAWEHFYDSMFASCRSTVFENSKENIHIVRAQLGDIAGWIGGAALARQFIT
ncbi:ROK family protein [candidate division KSB1 bacterium]|nr:ROK family protein [candidate division KSB1 bacterium]